MISCVFRCWVGKRHLDIALKQVKDEFDVQVHWRPFNLNPWLPEEGMNFKEFAIAKFGEDGLKRFTSGQVPFFERGKAVVRITIVVQLVNASL